MPPVGSFGAFSLGATAPMQAPMSPLEGAPEAGGATKTAGVGGFGKLLADAVSAVNEKGLTAARLQQQAASGQLADPTAAITATAESGIYMSTAVQVRNRLVESWQELSRMPV
jgi:flagellar hook-basal body complex protein FliE